MDISKSLFHFCEKRNNFFLTWSDISDFRTVKPITLSIHGKGGVLEVPIKNKQSFGVLSVSIFGENRVVISWDAKQFFSYLKYNLPKYYNLPISCELIDLKLCENYLGIKKDCPTSYEEASERTSLLLNNADICKINKKIFAPLSSKIIPSLETTGITNKIYSQKQYPYYIIEGQINGRLNTKVISNCFFNPHNLTQENKSEFSAGYERKFIIFDYKSMEVYVLAWLTKDQLLDKVIESGEDVYKAIYCIVAGTNKCSAENRKWIKSVFLPVIYGYGANALAENLDISTKAAESLIQIVRKNFKTADSWIQDRQEEAKNGKIKDVFGRVLDFSDKSPHKARNASIQSPAALICLDKFIQLHQQSYPSMEIVASIHDAFVCTVESSCCDSIASAAKEMLESPSQLAPDCVLRTSVKIGENWGKIMNNDLGLLARKFRQTRDKLERDKIAAEYKNVVDKLIAGGNWIEMPAFEDMLPDEYMPDTFFKFWRIK